MTSNKSPKILLTGHTGFIGQAVSSNLTKNGMDWLGASRSMGYDLEDRNSLSDIGEVDWVVHLAGYVDILESWQNPAAAFNANYNLTLTALEYARVTGANFLYLSSYLYGIPEYLPIDEEHRLEFKNPYAWSKRLGESLCESYSYNFGVNVTIFRPFNIYGPGQGMHQLMPNIIFQTYQGDTITLLDLTPRRDWLWVYDLADAILAAITNSPSSFEIFNVGFGKSFTVQEVVDETIRQVGPLKVVSEKSPRKNEIPECVCDISKIRKALNWKPITGLSEGISIMLRTFDDTNSDGVINK